MKNQDLIKLGLSPTESTLYLALLRHVTSDVTTLVQETGIYKANAYQALERLCEKGIISKINDGKKRIYQLQPPRSLIEFVEKKSRDIELQKQIAKKLAEEAILSKKQIASFETAAVFRGYHGIKQIYAEIIEKKLNYLVFGSPSASENIGNYYWQNIHAKQKEHNIHAKMIFHTSLRNWKKLIPRNIIELRFMTSEFEPLTETTIYGDKVGFVVWTEQPVTTIIHNEHVAASYKQVFSILWQNAKK
ncbi:MAG: helix-turn-helix domain-containing protein [Nanoarchaeota archaeon]